MSQTVSVWGGRHGGTSPSGRTIVAVWVAVVSAGGTGGLLRELDAAGKPAGPVEAAPELGAAVARWERAGPPRWVLTAVAQEYPSLLDAGVRLDRCHDLLLTEALLLGHAGRWGAPRSLAAAWARLSGGVVPDDPVPASRQLQPALFEPAAAGMPAGVDPLQAVTAVYADQRRRMAALAPAGRMRLLAAAESACALAAVEMGRVGMPWRADAHDALLSELLGPRPVAGARPPRLAELAERISAAFGGRPVNPDSPADVLRAFAREGIALASTRSYLLREVEHPAVPALLAYKELSRLHTAHGWNWLETWVHEGRFRPEYVVGGVVTGRWASRGGGALQIPRTVRRAVVADPGWVLVVADAGQLEPRVLAALSGDIAMAEAAGVDDLYEGLAERAFGGDRARAKLALLSAMYGGATGGAAELLAILHQRFPVAMAHVEAAARAGEEGRLVRSHLGRTCPPPGQRWREAQAVAGGPGADAEAERAAVQRGRERGRFTRNFIIQGTAAEWALILLATLRQRLAGTDAELVFFQHDEVIVHCRRELAEEVTEAVTGAAEAARRLMFGDTPVRFPVRVAVAERYSDAK
ncbi:MAG: bifunctional 3'-5' exonuclease/DNA polymerase [Actinobacteria bacterium]|nr:bifunctional 3'-5' exonuclease/DNA polymerase [Actinomycetota bacterium]MBI3687613.1 bifunctional 3'-5' exonuclease/DNA polymerase [Actinomycetota bacterium]